MGLGSQLVSRLKGFRPERVKQTPGEDDREGKKPRALERHPSQYDKNALVRTASYKAQAGHLYPGAQVVSVYQVQKILGSGAFADVWLAEHRESHEKVAVKVIDTAPKGRWRQAVALDNVGLGCGAGNPRPDEATEGILEKQIVAVAQREVDVMRLLSGRHENVACLLSSSRTPSRADLVMEFCPGGDLTHLILKRGGLPEPAAKVLFRQLVSAVSFCHSQGVIHRDIKLDNILFDSPPDSLLKYTPHRNSNREPPPVKAKLADFGTAALLQPGQTTAGYSGTRFFIAPEIVSAQRYGPKVDVFSLGVVLYSVLSGSLPPDEDHPGGISWFWVDIEKGKINLQLLSGRVSLEGRLLLKAMLQRDPQLRPNADEILAHPWFASLKK